MSGSEMAWRTERKLVRKIGTEVYVALITQSAEVDRAGGVDWGPSHDQLKRCAQLACDAAEVFADEMRARSAADSGAGG